MAPRHRELSSELHQRLFRRRRRNPHARRVRSRMKEIADILRVFQSHRGQPMALATVVCAKGSSYRRPGARMLICADGATAGSLSGGCLEEEVARRALEVMRDGTARWMHFDTRLRFG